MTRKPHSPRFVRLSEADISALFGGSPLEPRFTISNGRYVARQRVALVGDKGRIDGVPVVGPPTPDTSIAWSEGDAERVGFGERGVIVVGSHGELKVTQIPTVLAPR